MSVKGKVHFSFSVWPCNFKQHMWGGCLLDSRGEVNRNNKMKYCYLKVNNEEEKGTNTVPPPFALSIR